jgi:predicted pyridoxine 5'-phosphate oxidase superfamily flavin-nucleotide-binding protein
MSILETTPGLLDALRGDMTPKFLATRDAEGVPNVVPCVSMQPADDQPDTVFFGNFLLRKTIGNLQNDPRVGILVVTPELKGWILKGDFIEFQNTGSYFDRQMGSSLLRYNSYTGIRNAGIIRVRSVEREFVVPRVQVLLDYIRARMAGAISRRTDGAGIPLPPPVRKEFGRMVAVKVLAWVDQDGYPAVAPALSLQPAGDRALLAWWDRPAPAAAAPVAGCLLTFEAISYQAKGRWAPGKHTGAILVSEVYAGGPPLPGGRIA